MLYNFSCFFYSWHELGRFRQEGDYHGREWNARLDGYSQKVWTIPASERRPYCWLFAHDCPDCCPDRNPYCAWCHCKFWQYQNSEFDNQSFPLGNLVQLQHLQHSGSCCCCYCCCWNPCLCLEGRNWWRIYMVCRTDSLFPWWTGLCSTSKSCHL